MLAVFHKTIADGPDAITSPTSRSFCTGDLVAKFMANYQQSVLVKFDESSSMAFTHQRQALLTPRSLATVDDIFCLFEGGLENLAGLRQRYGLSKSVNEALLVIEAYRALRDRAPYPAHQVVGDLSGHFVFILYDNNTHKIFVAADCQGKVPLFWGTTSDGSIAFSGDEELIKEGCGRSFATFPQGCYFSSDEGLRSFEHPLKEVKAVPRLDSHGQEYGSTFTVDTERNLPRISPRKTHGLTTWGVA